MPQIDLGITRSEITDYINRKPPIPSRLLADPMWEVTPLNTTNVELGFLDGEIILIPTQSREAPPNERPFTYGGIKRSFIIPHLNQQTYIRASHIQDMRQFGSEDALMNNVAVLQNEINKHRKSYDATKEHLMLGAIKGQIVDSDGVTVLYDLFNEFGISKPQTTINFSDKTTNVGNILDTITDTMSDGLEGDVATGVTVLCSRSFFYKLTSHPSVLKALERHEENRFAREAVGKKFYFKGITFETYNFKVGGRNLIEEGHAHAFLNGMYDGFKLYYAPATILAESNKLARPFYVSTETVAHGRAVSLYTESNPLPLCTRPETLHELIAA